MITLSFRCSDAVHSSLAHAISVFGIGYQHPVSILPQWEVLILASPGLCIAGFFGHTGQVGSAEQYMAMCDLSVTGQCQAPYAGACH